MNWYVAKIIFRIATSSGQEVAQFDEHLRLIRAESFEQAFIKARLIGITEEDVPSTPQDKNTKWEFVNISELIPLKELCDGLEVYSQIHETVEARSYVNLVHQKAAALSAG
jgi:hypothetical protein